MNFTYLLGDFEFPLSLAEKHCIIEDALMLDTAIYIIDQIISGPYSRHIAAGVFFGLCFGHIYPSLAFWGASGIGFVKESIDILKHLNYTESYHFLTDPQYGIWDGTGDLFFYMVGGYLAYRILRRSHRLLKER